MREILFKGLRIDGGGWAYGYYTYHLTGAHVISQIVHIPPTMQDPGGDCKLIYHEVDPDTIGQYIGRRDKTGKRIFDGDILSGTVHTLVYGGKNDRFKPMRWVIEMHNCAWRGYHVSWEKLDKVPSSYHSPCCERFMKITGNIHDTLEESNNEL